MTIYVLCNVDTNEEIRYNDYVEALIGMDIRTKNGYGELKEDYLNWFIMSHIE